MRPRAILKLLQSVSEQTLYPNEIVVIDGSANDDTETILNQKEYKNLYYCKVDKINRGLTKQRNFGIEKVSKNSDIICFLDDDTI